MKMQVVCTTKKFLRRRHRDSYDLGTSYRPDSKWGPDLISQVLQVPQLSNLIRIVGTTWKIRGWLYRDLNLVWAQFTD